MKRTRWPIPEIPEFKAPKPINWQKWSLILIVISIVGVLVAISMTYSGIPLITGLGIAALPPLLVCLVFFYLQFSYKYNKQQQHEAWEVEKENIYRKWQQWAQMYWHVNDYTLILPDNIDITKIPLIEAVSSGKIRHNFQQVITPFSFFDTGKDLFAKRYDKKEIILEKILFHHLPDLEKIQDLEGENLKIIIVEDKFHSEKDLINRRLGENSVDLVIRLLKEQNCQKIPDVLLKNAADFQPDEIQDWLEKEKIKHALIIALSVNSTNANEAACSLLLGKTLIREELIKIRMLRSNSTIKGNLNEMLEQIIQYQLDKQSPFGLWLSSMDANSQTELIQVLYKHNIDLISLDSAHPMNDLDRLCGNLIPIQGWINLVSAAKFVGSGKGDQLAITQIDGRYGIHFFHSILDI